MTPKDYLMQIYNLDKRIDSKISERDAIMQTLLKATDTSQDRIYTNEVSSPVENAVIKLMEYDDETNDKVDELVNLKIKIAGEIDALDKDTHRIVLRERYIHCKKWEEIAVEQGYDLRWVYRLHGYALEEFEEKFPDKFTPC